MPGDNESGAYNSSGSSPLSTSSDEDSCPQEIAQEQVLIVKSTDEENVGQTIAASDSTTNPTMDAMAQAKMQLLWTPLIVEDATTKALEVACKTTLSEYLQL